jgi:predicted P-loop ATPase
MTREQLRELREAAEMHVNGAVASAPSQADALVAAGDAMAAYAKDFIEACSALDEDTLFDVRTTLSKLKDFSKREFDRRVKDFRISSMAPVASRATDNWKALLLQTDKGSSRPLLANAATALRSAPEWLGVLGYNEMSFRIEKLKPPPYTPSSLGQWTDTDDIKCAEWLQLEGITVGVTVAADASKAVAEEHPFHPVRSYLTSLKWDGEKRIHRFLCDYFGVEFSELSCLISKRWLISAVARVMKPGCQVDTCLVLEGAQGIRKSTTMRALAGQPEWFTDQVADLEDKDSSQDLAGKWIVEFPELEKFSSKHDQGVIKSYVPRQIDHYRASYGRRSQDWPRQCVFCASTNKFNWAGDESGGRRWLPVRCGNKVDIDGVRANRDQIWAEAYDAYLSDVRWWFDESDPVDITEELQDEQSARYESDPWDATVAAWIEEQDKACLLRRQAFYTKTETILDECLKKPLVSWTQIDKNRVAKIFSFHGLERFQRRMVDIDEVPILDQKGKQRREWCYRRKTL